MDIDDAFAKEAQESINFLAKLGAAAEKVDLYDDPISNLAKIAEVTKMDPGEIAVKMYKTAAIIEEDSPADIDFEAIEKVAADVLASIINSMAYQKRI